MVRWGSARFQTKLFLLFLVLSGIPSLLIGITAYQKSAGMLNAKTEQDLNVILAQLNTSFERQINDFDRFSILPYFLPETFGFLSKPYIPPEKWGTIELAAQRSLVRLMSAYPSIHTSIKGLMIYGMNGTENGYLVSESSTLNENAREREADWYKKVLDRRGGFVVSGIREINQFTGPPFRAIVGSRLILDDDAQPLAVVAIYILPDFIPKIVDALELSNVQVTVQDQERNVIYTSDKKLAEQLPAIVDEDNNGAWETTVAGDRNKNVYSGVYLKSKYLGWTVYMGVNKDEMLSGSRTIRSYTLAVVAITSIISAVVSWLLARGLSRPILNLIRSMREVERGNFSNPGQMDRGDEIGQLQKSYVRMVQRLDLLIHSIEEKEGQKRKAELYALRARIQPHFLYNTLNSIRMLAILQQSSQIAKLIHSLSKLLHANMKLDAELVTLDDELRLLKDYASLMDLRYTNVFEMAWQVPDRVLSATVPPMLLQPLLENAIFHGNMGQEHKLQIEVVAALQEDERTLIISIWDNGPGFTEDKMELPVLGDEETNSTHIGLRNVRDRIRLRFGEGYGLYVKRIGDRTCVELKMPYRTMGMEEEAYVESSRS